VSKAHLLDTGCAQGRYAVVALVDDAAGLRDLLGWRERHTAARSVLGIDCETNAEHPWSPAYRLRTVQVADTSASWVLDVEALGPDAVRQLVRPHPWWAAHYAEADMRFLERGAPGSLDLAGDHPQLNDTQVVLAYADPRTVVTRAAKEGIDPRLAHDKGLKETAERELSPMLAEVEHALHAQWKAAAPKGSRTQQAALRWGFANTPVSDPMFMAYAGLDPLFTVRLWHLLLERATRAGALPIVMRDLAWQWDIDRASLRGLRVERGYVEWLDDQLSGLTQAQRPTLARHGVPDSGQGQAVGRAFEALGVAPVKTSKTGAASWDRTVIKDLASGVHPNPAVTELANAVKLTRGATKFRSTYVAPMHEAVQTDSRVHWSHRIIGATTGRNTAARPPTQQLPKKDTRVRAAFVAEPGWAIVSCDFSQGEPRTMAGLSQDDALRAAILSGDLNSAIATAAHGAAYDPTQGKTPGTVHYSMRQGGKIGFLAKCYGGGAGTIGAALGMPIEQAREINARWEQAYADLFALSDRLNSQLSVRLESGRTCPLWDRYVVDDQDMPRPTDRRSRKGLNYATQGTQRDLLLASWERVRAAGLGNYLWMLVHDEILMHVPQQLAADAARVLQDAMTFEWRGMPFTAEAEINGASWMPRPAEFTAHDLALLDLDD
jgi:DNA polymerase I